MKTTLFKMVIITATLYIVHPLNFSAANTALQPLDRSFPWFEVNPMCSRLTFSYQDKEGNMKPMALESLPIEYYLHESIPTQYRPFFYVAADTWNKKLKEEIIRINSEIDRNPINTESNRSDRKNVIYLVDEEYFQGESTEFSQNRLKDIDMFIPGLSRHAPPEIIDESLPFFPITETDIMIREEILTDLELYRYTLIMNLQKLGVEGPLFDVRVDDLRYMVFFRLESMTVEEFRSLTLESLERTRDAVNNRSSNLIGMSDSQELDWAIEELRNMKPARVRSFKYDGIAKLLDVDMEMMRTQSSVILVSTIMHEMGHGLGLNQIPSNPDGPRLLMEEHPYNKLSEMTIPKEIDPYALLGTLCLYRDILSY